MGKETNARCTCGKPVQARGMCNTCYSRDYDRRYKECYGVSRSSVRLLSPKRKEQARRDSQKFRRRHPELLRAYEKKRHATEGRKLWRQEYMNAPDYKAKRRVWMRNQRKRKGLAVCKKENRRNVLRVHGLTEESFQALWDSQKGLCGICSDPLRLSNRGTHIDHDHVTNKVRGLLCTTCNWGLGHFHDDPRIMLSAIEYINRHKREVWQTPTFEVIRAA